jgi:hypothetical protein
MISRPPEELRLDYGAPSEALGEAGFVTSLLYDADGLLFSTTPQFARDKTLQLAVRQRGAFIITSRGHVYRVPGEQDWAHLCVALLRDLAPRGTNTPTGEEVCARYGLREHTSWDQEEREEEEARYGAHGWVSVSPDRKDRVWADFETLLAPEVKLLISPSVTWDISAAYVEDLSTDTEPDLTLKALSAMRAVSERDTLWYVFSDGHAALSGFLPWQAVAKPYWRWWKNPIMPRGTPPHMNVRTNHNCFVRRDFRAGFLTYLREDSLCVFGQDLLDALAEDPPLLLTKVRRRSGIPV